MNRRKFLAAAAAVPLVGLVPTPTSDPLPPREFHRYDYVTDSWSKITPADIRVGDVVRFYDPPPGENRVDETILVNRVEPDQCWSRYRIDPKTNQWV